MPNKSDEAADIDVVRRVLAGDVNAFEKLVARYQAYVFSIVRKHVPPENVEAVAHDIFVRAYRSLPGYGQKSQFAKWLAGISVRTCAIFLLGAMAGALATGLVVKHRVETFHEKGPPPIKPLFMQRLSHHLELNPEQKIAVSEILEDNQQKLGELRKTYKPRMRQIFSDCFNRIQVQLTPIQQERFESLQEKFPRMIPHRPFNHRPHHRPPHPENRY
jgi:DNA-directed RNA polymerase specialized sigma24 family protein